MNEPCLGHVALVGMPGTGKTTVADLVADRLGVAAAHLDEIVEFAADMQIHEIFALDGETRFREIESACLRELLDAAEPTVIACGGGVQTVAGNVRRLRRSDVTVVWLAARLSTLHERLDGAIRQRPLLAADGDLDVLFRQRRLAYWRLANVVVATDNRTPSVVADVVIDRLRADLLIEEAP